MPLTLQSWCVCCCFTVFTYSRSLFVFNFNGLLLTLVLLFVYGIIEVWIYSLLCHIQEYLSALVMHHFYFPLHYFGAFEFFPSSDDCWDIFFFVYLGHTRHSVESGPSWFDSASLIFILIGHFQVETADASQKESLCSRLRRFITLHAGPQIKTCEIC